MASKIKEVHQYDGTQWGQAVPIGADASNVDVRTSDNTDIPLQSVLGSFNATEPSIKTQINGKVDKEGGDVAHAVINDPVNEIPIYDLDTEETSEKLISDDISTDTDMVVMSGDGENLTTMWGKFNRFRKRVDNKFKNYLVTSLEGVAPGASSDTKGYSTQALNNYFNDVIGYTSAASVAQTGSVASQLSSLNNNAIAHPINFTSVNGTTPYLNAWYIGMVVYIAGYISNVTTAATSEKIIAAVTSNGIIPYPQTPIRIPARYGQPYFTGNNCYVSVRELNNRIEICTSTPAATSNTSIYFGSIVYYGYFS